MSCVNAVGVEVNTASKHLLTYVSGLGPQLAQNIIDYRTENGPFRARKELLKVKRMGEKAFETSAGFLRNTKCRKSTRFKCSSPRKLSCCGKNVKGYWL